MSLKKDLGKCCSVCIKPKIRTFTLTVKVQPILIIHRCHICNSSTCKNLFVTSKLIPGTLSVICGHAQSDEKFESSNAHIFNWGLTRRCSAFLVHFFLVFLSFLLVVSLFNMAPEIVLKGYPVFLRIRRLWCALWGNYVLDKLCSVMSNSAVAHVFSVNESE